MNSVESLKDQEIWLTQQTDGKQGGKKSGGGGKMLNPPSNTSLTPLTHSTWFFREETHVQVWYWSVHLTLRKCISQNSPLAWLSVCTTGISASGVGKSGLPGHLLSRADSTKFWGQLWNSAQRFSEGESQPFLPRLVWIHMFLSLIVAWQEEKFGEVSKALQLTQIQWTKRGPANKR